MVKQLGYGSMQPTSFSIVTSADTPANITTTLAAWRKLGRYMFLDVHLQFTGASGGATAFIFDLPIIGGAQTYIDSAYIGGSFGTANATRSHFGVGTWFLSGTGWIAVEVCNDDSSGGLCKALRFFYSAQGILESQLTTGGALRFTDVKVPIIGWS